jgi:hypothetical protein
VCARARQARPGDRPLAALPAHRPSAFSSPRCGGPRARALLAERPRHAAVFGGGRPSFPFFKRERINGASFPVGRGRSGGVVEASWPSLAT